jgi:hypothetical protein
LKIREEGLITALSPSNEPQDSIEGSSPSKNKSLNLQIDINCLPSSEGNQSNPRKRKNKRSNQDELDKKLEKVMRHTPNSY